MSEWRIINKTVEDGQKTTVKGLQLGKGVLLITQVDIAVVSTEKKGDDKAEQPVSFTESTISTLYIPMLKIKPVKDKDGEFFIE